MTIPIGVVDKGGAASYGGRHQSGLLILVSKRKFVLVSDTQSKFPVVWRIRLIWSRMPWSSGGFDRTNRPRSGSGDPVGDTSQLKSVVIRESHPVWPGAVEKTVIQLGSWCRNRPGRVVSTGDPRSPAVAKEPLPLDLRRSTRSPARWLPGFVVLVSDSQDSTPVGSSLESNSTVREVATPCLVIRDHRRKPPRGLTTRSPDRSQPQ